MCASQPALLEQDTAQIASQLAALRTLMPGIDVEALVRTHRFRIRLDAPPVAARGFNA